MPSRSKKAEKGSPDAKKVKAKKKAKGDKSRVNVVDEKLCGAFIMSVPSRITDQDANWGCHQTISSNT